MFIRFILLSFVLFGSLFAEEKRDWTAYASAESCFRILFPPRWNISLVDEDGEDVQAVAPQSDAHDIYHENIVVWVEPLAESFAPDQYYQVSLKNLAAHVDSFSLLDEGVDTLSKHKAHWFHARVKEGAVVGEVLQYQLLAEGRIYIINCTAEPSKFTNYLPLFQQAIASFVLDL